MNDNFFSDRIKQFNSKKFPSRPSTPMRYLFKFTRSLKTLRTGNVSELTITL